MNMNRKVKKFTLRGGEGHWDRAYNTSALAQSEITITVNWSGGGQIKAGMLHGDPCGCQESAMLTVI
jgi:hypothetical protein